MNVEYTVNDANQLVITVDIGQAAINASRPSSTGKTNLVASTNGAVEIPSEFCRELKFSINVMCRR